MKKVYEIKLASIEDAEEILNLQKVAYRSEAELHNDFQIPPLHQPLSEVEKEIKNGVVLKICEQGRIVGSIRAYQQDQICFIGKLIVQPEFQNQGMGSALLDEIESRFQEVASFELFTGYLSKKNIGMYQRRGYQIFDQHEHLVFLKKHNSNKVSETDAEMPQLPRHPST